MIAHLGSISARFLFLVCLLILAQSLLFEAASGQQKKQGGKKKSLPQVVAEPVPVPPSDEAKRKVDIAVENPATVPPVRRGVTATVVAEDGSDPFKEDPEITILFRPCKGEVPGNVLGVSEQLAVPVRVAAFVKKLQETDPKTRACAARQLGYLGREATDAVPYLIKLIRDEENGSVFPNIRDALWAIGPRRSGSSLNDSKSNDSELLELSRSPDVYVRIYAVFALGYYKRIGNEKAIVQALISATKDQDMAVRGLAVKGLGRLGPVANSAVPLLIELMRDQDRGLRKQAVMALGGIGPGAAEAAPALLEELHKADFDTYYLASIALGRIGPAILPLMEAEIKTRPFQALEVLNNLRPDGAPLVIEALRMPDKKVRLKAIEIIQFFGPAAEPAVPLLVSALKDQDREIRGYAANALRNIGVSARGAVPALTAGLDDKDGWVRCSAAKALGAIGPAAKPAVPKLLQMMNLEVGVSGDMAQRCAAEGLMNMSAETKAMVPPKMVKRVEEWNALGASTLPPLFEVDETKPKPKEKKKPAQEY